MFLVLHVHICNKIVHICLPTIVCQQCIYMYIENSSSGKGRAEWMLRLCKLRVGVIRHRAALRPVMARRLSFPSQSTVSTSPLAALLLCLWLCLFAWWFISERHRTWEPAHVRPRCIELFKVFLQVRAQRCSNPVGQCRGWGGGEKEAKDSAMLSYCVCCVRKWVTWHLIEYRAHFDFCGVETKLPQSDSNFSISIICSLLLLLLHAASMSKRWRRGWRGFRALFSFDSHQTDRSWWSQTTICFHCEEGREANNSAPSDKSSGLPAY